MRIKVNLYKESGKWYGSCEVDIPDGTMLFHDNVPDCVYKAVENGHYSCPQQFNMTVENVNENDPFFVHLFKARTV